MLEWAAIDPAPVVETDSVAISAEPVALAECGAMPPGPAAPAESAVVAEQAAAIALATGKCLEGVAVAHSAALVVAELALEWTERVAPRALEVLAAAAVSVEVAAVSAEVGGAAKHFRRGELCQTKRV